MPQAGGPINTPPKPKPAPKPKPVPVSSTSQQQNVAENYTNKADAKAKAKIKNVSTEDYGEPTPHKASAKKNAGAGRNPNLDTTATASGARFSASKAGKVTDRKGRTISGTVEVIGGMSPAKQRAARSGVDYTGSNTRSGGGTFSKGGSTFSGGTVGVTRGGGGGGRDGFGGGGRTGGGTQADRPPSTIRPSDRVGGGFPEYGGGYRGTPAFFDTGGAGGGGGGAEGANPLAGGSSFTGESLDEVLHGAKKKGRVKRARKSE